MQQLELALKDEERTVVLIDGSNIFATAKALNLHIDYKLFRKLFDDRCDLRRMYYYTAILESDKDEDPNPLIPLLDWLSYNGYHMVTKKARQIRIQRGEQEFTKIKGNVDIEIAVEMTQMAERVDHIVLVSGDGDFVRAVQYAQEKACKVSVLSSIKTDPIMIADELRRQSDYFIDLADIAEHIRAKPKVTLGNEIEKEKDNNEG